MGAPGGRALAGLRRGAGAVTDGGPDLSDWGWGSDWAERVADVGDEYLFARVTEQNRDQWVIQAATGPIRARLRPAAGGATIPVVGDWVAVRGDGIDSDPVFIEHVLPRRTELSRGAAGSGARPQVLAANIDRVWIVHGLDVAPNLRRLERYLALAWETGATPEILLTKADLSADVDGAVAEVQAIAFGTPVRAVSVDDLEGVALLREGLDSGRTVVLIGPSGVGKSTLINMLAASDLAAIGVVRGSDRKGRHTTTRRELFRLDGGALLLDTPGVRELRVWELDDGLEGAFPEIAELSAACRFRDCGHDAEPGCAVLEALDSGALDQARLDSFRKLRAEAEYQRRKSDPVARAAHVSEFKSIMRSLKHHPKHRDRS